MKQLITLSFNLLSLPPNYIKYNQHQPEMRLSNDSGINSETRYGVMEFIQVEY